MRIPIILIFALFANYLISQRIDSIEIKHLDLVERMTYGSTAEIFKKKENIDTYNQDYIKPWEKDLGDKNKYHYAFDTIKANATVTLEKGSYSNQLAFHSFFPVDFGNGLVQNFKISLDTTKLFSNDSLLEIRNNPMSFYGSISNSGIKDGTPFNKQWRTITTTFQMDSAFDSLNINGSAEFECGFISEYDYIKITHEDIGEKMSIAGLSFTVIDIIGPSIILKFDTEIKGITIETLNLTDEGYKITGNELTFSSFSVYEKMYEVLKNKNELSLEEYKAIFHPKFLTMLEEEKLMNWNSENYKLHFGEEYKVFSSSGEIVNAYLFIPKYYNTTFEVKYKNGVEIKHPGN